MHYGHALRIIGTQHSDQIKKALSIVQSNIKKIHDAPFILNKDNLDVFKEEHAGFYQTMKNYEKKIDPFQQIKYEKNKNMLSVGAV